MYLLSCIDKEFADIYPTGNVSLAEDELSFNISNDSTSSDTSITYFGATSIIPTYSFAGTSIDRPTLLIAIFADVFRSASFFDHPVPV